MPRTLRLAAWTLALTVPWLSTWTSPLSVASPSMLPCTRRWPSKTSRPDSTSRGPRLMTGPFTVAGSDAGAGVAAGAATAVSVRAR